MKPSGITSQLWLKESLLKQGIDVKARTSDDNRLFLGTIKGGKEEMVPIFNKKIVKVFRN